MENLYSIVKLELYRDRTYKTRRISQLLFSQCHLRQYVINVKTDIND